jgi:hypothetical protein
MSRQDQWQAAASDNGEHRRAERLLRLAADWEPDRSAPDDLAQRALLRVQRPAAPAARTTALRWNIGTVCAGAAASLLVAAVHTYFPESGEIRPAEQPVPVASAVKAAADTSGINDSAPESSVQPEAGQSAVSAQTLTAAPPVRMTTAEGSSRRSRPVSSGGRSHFRLHGGNAARSLANHMVQPRSSSAPTSVAAPAAVAPPRPMPTNAISLDEETATVVPVVFAEADPDSAGGVRMTPAAVTISAAPDAPSLESTE